MSNYSFPSRSSILKLCQTEIEPADHISEQGYFRKKDSCLKSLRHCLMAQNTSSNWNQCAPEVKMNHKVQHHSNRSQGLTIHSLRNSN